MNRIEESELIINKRGAIYHLNVRPEEIASTIITVGNPARAHEVSKHFDSIEFSCRHREFVTHTGFIGNKRLSVVSTGIGTDNIDIVLNELDALFNIDLENRSLKKELTRLTIIRIGTSGSLKEHISVDSFVASTHGLGIDNLLNFYQQNNNDEERVLLQQFVMHMQIESGYFQPYITGASVGLMKNFVSGFHHGITVTCPGFYAPQGRILRLGLSNPDFIDRLTEFSYGNHSITNFEMETSAIYGLGKLLGHQCISLSAIIAGRIQKTFTKDVDAVVDRLILKALDIIATL